MRRRHFEALRPLCPVCQAAGRTSPLAVASAVREEGESIVEGILGCSEPGCLREYPIVDGMPLIVGPLREYFRNSVDQINARRDLSETLESIVGDCCGPESAFNATRQHLSSYAWDHYGDLDPSEPGGDGPASVVGLLERGLELGGEIPAGPILDVGCAVGRTSFALAERFDVPVLGAELNFAMLRLASEVLHRGVVRYPRRRVGLVYDRREFRVDLPRTECVDFWVCDAAALPFGEATFAAALSLNVVDCVQSPVDSLRALARVLAPGGTAVICSPYDWAPAATPVEAWLGGHSQRGPDEGGSAAVLRRLLTPGGHPASIEGLELVAEEAGVPWRVRMHERSTVEYQTHLMVARKVKEPA